MSRSAARTWHVIPETGCHVWTGPVHKDTPVTHENGIVMPTHRWAWMKRHGALPGGVHIKRWCSTTACILPDHHVIRSPLRLVKRLGGTRQDLNMAKLVLQTSREKGLITKTCWAGGPLEVRCDQDEMADLAARTVTDPLIYLAAYSALQAKAATQADD